MSSEADNTSSTRTTEVLYGADNTTDKLLQVFNKIKSNFDACGDSTSPSVCMGFEPLRNAYLDFKRRGINVRFITEMNPSNISYCKELMKISELRHLDGIKGNFGICDQKEFVAAATIKEQQAVPQLIYSNVKEIIEQQAFIFESFWTRAIPAKQRIREMEDATEPEFYEVISDHEKASQILVDLAKSVKKEALFLLPNDKSMVRMDRLEVINYLIKAAQKDSTGSIRIICPISEVNSEIIKKVSEKAPNITILNGNNSPYGMYIVDNQRAFRAELKEPEAETFSEAIGFSVYSTRRNTVDFFKSVFELLWNERKLNEDLKKAATEVIQNPHRILELFINMIKLANQEILLVLPTTNAFLREDRVGIIKLLNDAAMERNLVVRIVTPTNEIIEKKIQNILVSEGKEVEGERGELLALQEEREERKRKNFDVRRIDITTSPSEKIAVTTVTIIVADKKESLVIEKIDDSTENFIEAAGLATYSNSKPTVMSYVSIFENLWNQAELYLHIKEAHEKLKMHDKMQKEFINVAAHELRTPIQPILGLLGLLRSKKNDIKKQDLDNSLNLLMRNAQRLKRLSEDILDVTKIESQSLKLNKELIILDDVILNAIQDSRNQVAKNRGNIKMIYKPDQSGHGIIVEADRNRLNQVIYNLLSNAIKFTEKEGGIVSVRMEKKKGNDNDNDDEVVVSVKDSGPGISSEMFPRLFEKFASKSFQGTGLGLFISKNIVEAHGGKIWGENNIRNENNHIANHGEDVEEKGGGRGACFYFTLPIANEQLEPKERKGSNAEAVAVDDL
jgi:two-component system, OmpR family, sensor histidine kinase VicK